MEFKQEPIPNQRFDMGRVITLTKCGTMECCTGCDFMHCGNYARKMRQIKYKKEDFFEEYKKELIELNKEDLIILEFYNDYHFRMTNDMFYDMFEFLDFNFPKNTYWDIPGGEYPHMIRLVKFNRKKEEVVIGSISITTPRITEYEFTDAQYKLAAKIRDVLLWLKQQTYDAIVKDYESTSGKEGIK